MGKKVCLLSLDENIAMVLFVVAVAVVVIIAASMQPRRGRAVAFLYR
jgi:hypothetical protein